MKYSKEIAQLIKEGKTDAEITAHATKEKWESDAKALKAEISIQRAADKSGEKTTGSTTKEEPKEWARNAAGRRVPKSEYDKGVARAAKKSKGQK